MSFNPPARRIKSRKSNSPTVETTPNYSFNAQLSSVPVIGGRITVPWQWTPFVGKLQSLAMEKLFFSFLHLFCKFQSKSLFGQERHCFPITFKGSKGNSIRIYSSFYLCPKTWEEAEATEAMEFPQGPSALIAFNRINRTEGWLSEAAKSHFISSFKKKIHRNMATEENRQCWSEEWLVNKIQWQTHFLSNVQTAAWEQYEIKPPALSPPLTPHFTELSWRELQVKLQRQLKWGVWGSTSKAWLSTMTQSPRGFLFPKALIDQFGVQWAKPDHDGSLPITLPPASPSQTQSPTPPFDYPA